MLIDGPGVSNRHFSQPALTIGQLIQTNFCKNKSHDIQQSRKILKKKETPVALYSTLKIYGTFRSKTVTDHYFNVGLCLSNDRSLGFTKKLSDAQIENYELTGVFSSDPLRKSIFTVVVKDNIDFNATPSATVKNFHGTSMTVMQFPSAENLGNNNGLPERCQLIDEQTKKASKKVLKVPESYETVKSLSVRKAPLYSASVAVDVSQYLDNGLFIASEKLKGQSWLQKIADIDNIISWSKYHSDNTPNLSLKGINAE